MARKVTTSRCAASRQAKGAKGSGQQWHTFDFVLLKDTI